jgi:hypothetical protein
LQGSSDEVSWTRSVFSTPRKTQDPEKKPEDAKGDFPESHKEVNYICDTPDSYESRRKQKLTTWEVLSISPATPSA